MAFRGPVIAPVEQYSGAIIRNVPSTLPYFALAVPTTPFIVGAGVVRLGWHATAALTGPHPKVAIGQTSPLAPNAIVAAAPTPRVSVYGAAAAKIAAPSPQVTATGTGLALAHAALTAPMATLAIIGTKGGSAALAMSAPRPRLIAYGAAVVAVTLHDGYVVKVGGSSGGVAHAVITAPLFQVIVSGSRGNSARANIAAPMLRPVPSALAHLVGPAGRLVALGTATVTITTEAYAMQMLVDPQNPAPIRAVSHYTSYPFTQIIRHNDVYYGVAADGLYQLGNDINTDAGAAIPWAMQTGLDDFKSKQLKRVSSMYIDGRLNSTVTVDVIVGEKEDDTYSYTTVRGSNVQNYRVQLGKGLRSRYYGFGISDSGGNKGEVDSIDIIIDNLKRAI